MTICWTQRILLIMPINKVKLDEGNSPFMRTSTLVLSLAVVFRKTKRLNLDFFWGDYMILGFSFSIKFGLNFLFSKRLNVRPILPKLMSSPTSILYASR